MLSFLTISNWIDYVKHLLKRRVKGNPTDANTEETLAPPEGCKRK